MRTSRLITSIGILLVGLGLWIGFVGSVQEMPRSAGATAAAPGIATGETVVVRPATPAELPGLTLIENAPALDAARQATGSLTAAPTSAESQSQSHSAAVANPVDTELLGQGAAAAGAAAIVRQTMKADREAAPGTAETPGPLRPVTVRPPQSAIEDSAALADGENRGEARKASPSQRRVRATTARPSKSSSNNSSTLLTNPLGFR